MRFKTLCLAAAVALCATAAHGQITLGPGGSITISTGTGGGGGSTNALSVQSVAVSATPPADKQVLSYDINTTQWLPVTLTYATPGACSTGQFVTATAMGTAPTCGQIAFSNIIGTAPTWNQNTTGTAAGLSGSPSIAITNLTGSGSVVLTGIKPSAGTYCLQVDSSGNVTNAGRSCGAAAVSVTTTSAITASGVSAYYYNQHATAATAVTYTLPTAVAGTQFCFKNSNNGTAADTGALKIQSAATGQKILYNGSASVSGGYVISSGAAGDSACVVGISTTQWEFYPSVGSWTLN